MKQDSHFAHPSCNILQGRGAKRASFFDHISDHRIASIRTASDHVWPCLQTGVGNFNKKLIRRWDSERELSLRRHRTRTTKYNRLVYKFRHRSTRLCVRTHIY